MAPTRKKTKRSRRKVTYIAEKILDKRFHFVIVNYLVKWKDYPDPSDNSWEPIPLLINCIPLIEKYEVDEYNKKIEKEKDKTDYGSQYNTIKNGELVPERIFGVKKTENELHFLTKMVNSEIPELIPSGLAREICPNVILDFYEKNLSWEKQKSM